MVADVMESKQGMKRKLADTRRIATVATSLRGRLCRSLTYLLLSFCLLCGPMALAHANETRSATEDLIRSAMVYNFCKFVEWPTDGHSLVLGVLGDVDEAPDFSSIVGKSVRGSEIVVLRLGSLDEMQGCDLVFITRGQAPILADALQFSRSRSILTISEIDDFCVQGGIIQLVERRGKLRFFVNRKAADRASLSLSSQLLKMAKIVEGD
jgi:hypothetical protein